MNKKHIILIHCIFWVFYILLPFVPLIFPDRQYPDSVYIYFYMNAILNIVNFYIAYFMIKPDSNLQRKLVKVLIVFFTFVIGFSIIRIYATVGVLIYFGVESSKISINIASANQELLNTLGFSFVPITIRYSLDWVRAQQLRSELVNQNQAGEIALLKSQLNPHFLFNTLNNIYALVLKKSDDAPEAILKVSGIMRYMLYDSNTEQVSLKSEIDYLKSYIELQALRYKDSNFVNFEISGEVENKTIAPLLFISLVENAFKHGSKKLSPAISISLDVSEDILKFTISNPVDSEMTSDEHNSGIGLKNVSRRLELIYPNRHSFITERIDSDFFAEIIIKEI